MGPWPRYSSAAKKNRPTYEHQKKNDRWTQHKHLKITRNHAKETNTWFQHNHLNTHTLEWIFLFVGKKGFNSLPHIFKFYQPNKKEIPEFEMTLREISFSTLYQTTNFGNLKEFADDNFKLDENGGKFSKLVEKHWEKENCLLRAISPFPTVFSNDLYCRQVKTRACLGKGNPIPKYAILRPSQIQRSCRRQLKCSYERI